MFAAQVLLARLGGKHGAVFGALAGELVVGALVEGQLFVLKMQDAVHRAVQQAAVVADDQNGVGIFLQIRLEPERTFKVEVVGWFVEQQEVRLREQHARQRHPHAPAAGEVRAGHQLLFRRKAQPLQDRRRAPLCRPGVDIGKTVLDIGDAVRIGCRLGFGHQFGAFGVRRKDGFQQRGRGRGHLLRDAADAGAGGQADVAALQHQLAADQAEKRGFPRPIAADEAHFVTGGNTSGRALEQWAAVNGITDVFDAEHGASPASSGAERQSVGFQASRAVIAGRRN
ncbi:hypothetical protein GALL_521220 [mine drainage metagenome]|uniref:Uncharacterized protein n=1 Tax=mine drainage metagenome TaxID=410659 RepID=A0A1J5P548_9ZZZZ